MNTLGQLHGTQTSRDRVVLFLLFFSREIYIFCKRLVMKERRKEEGNKNTLAAIFCYCFVFFCGRLVLVNILFRSFSTLNAGFGPSPSGLQGLFCCTLLFLFLGIRHFPSSHPQLHWLFFSSSSLSVFQAPPLSFKCIFFQNPHWRPWGGRDSRSRPYTTCLAPFRYICRETRSPGSTAKGKVDGMWK